MSAMMSFWSAGYAPPWDRRTAAILAAPVPVGSRRHRLAAHSGSGRHGGHLSLPARIPSRRFMAVCALVAGQADYRAARRFLASLHGGFQCFGVSVS